MWIAGDVVKGRQPKLLLCTKKHLGTRFKEVAEPE